MARKDLQVIRVPGTWKHQEPIPESKRWYHIGVMKIPHWLATLPPGDYTLKDFMKLTGRDHSNLQKEMIRMGIKKSYKPNPNHNASIVVYTWLGLEEHAKQLQYTRARAKTDSDATQAHSPTDITLDDTTIA